MGVETLLHVPGPQKGGLHPQLVLQPGSRVASAPQGTRRATVTSHTQQWRGHPGLPQDPALQPGQPGLLLVPPCLPLHSRAPSSVVLRLRCHCHVLPVLPPGSCLVPQGFPPPLAPAPNLWGLCPLPTPLTLTPLGIFQFLQDVKTLTASGPLHMQFPRLEPLPIPP